MLGAAVAQGTGGLRARRRSRRRADAMLAQGRLIRVQSKPAQGRAAAEPSHQRIRLRAQLRIVGVQHQQAGRHHGGGDSELDVRQSGQVVDAVFAEMIGAHVGDDRGVGLRHRDSATQDAAACRFQNGRLGARLAHHHARAGGPGIIARRQRFVIEKYAVRAVVSRAPAMGPRAGGEKPHGGGLAVGPGDDGRRNVSQFLPGNLRGIRQCSERKTAPAHARSQGQFRLIEHMRQPARRGRIEQCPQLRLRFQGGETLKARERRGFIEDRREIGFGMRRTARTLPALRRPAISSRPSQRTGSRSISAAHSAHSLTSVARNN